MKPAPPCWMYVHQVYFVPWPAGFCIMLVTNKHTNGLVGFFSDFQAHLFTALRLFSHYMSYNVLFRLGLLSIPAMNVCYKDGGVLHVCAQDVSERLTVLMSWCSASILSSLQLYDQLTVQRPTRSSVQNKKCQQFDGSAASQQWGDFHC